MSAQKNKAAVPVLISLGSNINPEENLRAALVMLAKRTSLEKKSSIWRSPAVGSSGPDYLNSTALIRTRLSRDQIKQEIISDIENRLGRIRSADKFMDRTIDLDILIYGNQVLDYEIWSQAHLAVPASELLPGFLNHETGETLQQAAERLILEFKNIRRIDLL